MATHSLNNGIPVGMENRHLLYERHYYESDCEDKKHGKTKHHYKHHHKTKNHHEGSYKAKKPYKTKCPPKTKSPPKRKKPCKEKKPPKAKNPPYNMKKPKKLKNPPDGYKDPPKVDDPYSPGGNNPDDPYNPGGNNPDDPYNPGGNNPGGNNPDDPYNPGGNNPGGNNPDDPYNPGGNNPSDPYNPGGNNPSPYNPGGNNPGGNNPGGLDGPPNPSGSSPSENMSTSVYQTSTAMPNALPSEQNRPTLSTGGIAIVTAILVGVIALVAFVVYRKRSRLRKGAVRLEDYDDESVEPRFLSMSNIRSLRVPSVPPKVQLTRLSSATILLPYRNSTTLNDNLNNNGYLSPNTINHNLSRPIPKSPLSPGLLTPDDYNDYNNSQRTDSVQSQPSSNESYTSLESSFPVPPQRIDRSNSTPTSATFGDIYNLKII